MVQDHGVRPEMENPVDSQASLDSPSSASAGMPARAPRRSVFREVPWRWSDVLIGFAPFLLLRAATFLIGLRSPEEFASGSRLNF